MIRPLFFFTLFVFCAPVLAQNTPWEISTCIGAYCGGPGGNFNGDSPLYSTGQPDLDKARWNAYRSELNEQYNVAIGQLNVAVEKWASDKAAAENLSVEQLEVVKTQAMAQLQASLPPVPQNLPTLQERRLANPYPSQSQAILDKQLDGIWNEIQTGTPIKVSQELTRTLKNYTDINGGSPVEQLLRQRSEFLRKELLLSRVTDSQGLLNVPNVQKPDITLQTSATSGLGNQIRGDLNRSLAGQSMARAKCSAPGADASLCAQLDAFYEATHVGLYAMDRWGQQQLNSMGQVDPAYAAILKSIENEIAFAEGFFAGGVDMFKGVATMVAHPVQTMSGLATAIWNYDKTYEALETAVVKVWNDYLTGDNAARAYILGKVGFEVVSALVPSSKVAWLEKVSKSSTIVARATQEVAQVIKLSTKVGAATPSEIRAIVRMNRELFRDTLASSEKIGASLNQLTGAELKAYTSVVNEMGAALTPGAHNYLAKQVGYSRSILNQEVFDTQKLTDRVTSYLELEKKFDSVAGRDMHNVTVTRGVDSIYKPTAENAFQIHSGNTFANGRYSAPGDRALYTSVGDLSTTQAVIKAEIPIVIGDLFFYSKEVSVKNILDLTDSSVLNRLEVLSSSLVTKGGKEPYQLPHQLGHIAREKGYGGILAPSAEGLSGNINNLIIFTSH